MPRLTGLIPFVFGLALQACASPPEPPPPGIAISLGDAMIQTVEALAATRAHAARLRGLRACGAEAVFHVAALPVADAQGRVAAHLVLAPPDSQDDPHSSTVTLTLAGDDCDTPQPVAQRRQR